MTPDLTPTLPPLNAPCPDCTGPEAEAVRAANAADWRTWNDEAYRAYEAFVATYTGFSAYEAWQCTDQYRELKARQPEDVAPVGCVECDWIGRRPTEAGRQVLDFLASHQQKG